MTTAPSQSSGVWRRWFWIVAITLPIVAVAVYWGMPPTLPQLLEQSQQAFRTSRFDTAVTLAQRALTIDPDSPVALRILAEIGFRSRRPEVWEPAFARIETLDAAAAFELWMKFGSEAMQHSLAQPAELALDRARKLSPERPEPWRLLSQLFSVQGRAQENAECLIALIRLRDYTRQDLDLLAWPNAVVGDMTRVEALLTANPDYLVPVLSLVGAALNENHTAEAERLLMSILERHPDQTRAIGILGRLLAERDAPEFLDWQRRWSSQAEAEPETRYAQGVWLRNHGQLSASARAFHQVIELDPRHQNALSQLGMTLQALGEKELAAQFLERARQQQEVLEYARRVSEKGTPENARALIERLEETGRLWEAWGWCRVLLHDYPYDSFLHARSVHLESRLLPDFPRTDPTSVPGRDFNWSSLAEPDWSSSSQSPTETAATASPLIFEDDAARLGIDFQFENGPPKGKTIVQTSGGGVAAVDYDRDGWCDLYFTQGGTDLAAPMQTALDFLFRNIEGTQFENVTAVAGLHEDRFSQGVAAGDIDNDGFPDLYVANLGQNRLWHNNGDGTFTDITAAAGLTSTGWTISTAIADLNGDGHPELFAVRYTVGSDLTTRVCRESDGRPSICRPTVFDAETDLLAVNSGDGRFLEQCAEVGLDVPEGRGFGSVISDFNGDGRLDIFVANDQTANFLHIQDGTAGPLHFTDEALLSGVAFDRDGFPQACMGIASADINNDGRTDLFITNFADESDALYVSQPEGGYLDMARSAGLRDPTFAPLGFGTQFLDADLDGQLDLIALYGHIDDKSDIGKPQAMLPLLFRGLPDGRFATVQSPNRRDFLNQPRVGRGLCVLDWNRDGKPDFAGAYLDENAVLATNRSETNGHWLALEFVGVRSSRDAIGTKVRLIFTDGTERRWQCTAGDGFAATNQRRLHLGLGTHSAVSTIEVQWPSGESQRFIDVSADRVWTVIEGQDALR